MDARAAASSLADQPPSLRRWLAAERANGRFYRVAELAAGLILLVMLVSSVSLLRGGEPGSMLSPPLIALLLVANLIPAIVLMVLFSRRLAIRRAEQGGLGTGSLHTRLVALFSVIAAVPTVLVAIFASLLFQSALSFWFSDKARGMLENSVQLAQGTYNRELQRVADETTTMSGDLAGYLRQVSIDDPRFADAFARNQILQRNLSEATIFTVGADGQILTQALVNPYDRDLANIIPPAKIAELRPGKPWVEVSSADRVGALTRLDFGPDAYVYAARVFEPEFREQMARATDVLRDYRSLVDRSRINQLRFNAALLLGSLVIVGLSILGALKLADRLVRPVGALVNAAGRVEEGDFSARVPIEHSEDEIGVLAAAFNRMTGRLEEQTGTLRAVSTLR